ncbi:MAG: NmrA/HSCARG family protein [Actinobacteria bacterium]|nr:NmrA/HSCARG family protein [Actinomycetota bacterium]
MSGGSDRAPVLVTGATGPHGGAVIAGLLEAGTAVRALTRDPSSERARALSSHGAEAVAGDMGDAASLVAAMAGVGAVYAVTTPFGAGTENEEMQGEQLIAAAEQAGVPWLILASVASAEQPTGVPHFESKRRIEERLRASSLPHTVVAPTYFYENLGDPRELIAGGELSLPLPPSQPLQQVALADLGRLVAALLHRREEFLGRRIEVAGDDPTPAAMASALAAAAGTPVAYRRRDLEEVAARSADLAAMFGFLAEVGYRVDLAGLRASFPELGFTPFEAWARRQLSG